MVKKKNLDIRTLRHPKEVSRFWVALIVVIPLVLLALAYIIVSLGLALLIVYLAFLLIRNIAYSYILGNYARVSEKSFAKIQRLKEEVLETLECKEEIDVFIYEDGSFNAALNPFLKRRGVFLNSALVDGATDSEIKWIIARFVGYLIGKKSRFLVFQMFLNGFQRLVIFNIFLYPYERAAVLTGDRIGAYAIDNNKQTVISVFHKLMVGPEIWGQISTDELFIQQRELGTYPFSALLSRLFSRFPHTTYRYTEMYNYLSSHPVALSSTDVVKDSDIRVADESQTGHQD